MRYQGTITSWKDERGFGFIAPSHGGDAVFVHITSFASRRRRPLEKEAVTYQLQRDAQGRPQAKSVAFVAEQDSPVVRALFIAAVFLAVVSALTVYCRLSPLVLAMYVVASLITFVAYARDKAAAQRDEWRTSEATLHLLSLLGGWPGALVAQQVFRHKSQKWSFSVVFRRMIFLNCAAIAWLLSPYGPPFVARLYIKHLERPAATRHWDEFDRDFGDE